MMASLGFLVCLWILLWNRPLLYIDLQWVKFNQVDAEVPTTTPSGGWVALSTGVLNKWWDKYVFLVGVANRRQAVWDPWKAQKDSVSFLMACCCH